MRGHIHVYRNTVLAEQERMVCDCGSALDNPFAVLGAEVDRLRGRLEAAEALLRAVHEQAGNIHFSMLWDDWFAKRDALLKPRARVSQRERSKR